MVFTKRRQVLSHAGGIHVARVRPDSDIYSVEPHLVNRFRHFIRFSQPLQMAGEDIDFQRPGRGREGRLSHSTQTANAALALAWMN